MATVSAEKERVSTRPADKAAPAQRAKPEWAPHIWEGMEFCGWLRLLARNRFAVHPALWYVAIVVTIVSFCHTLLRLLQDAIYGRRVRETVIQHPPIFIIGHWRTGTTFLHELLVQDERHSYPSTYASLDPNDFLLTEKILTRWLHFLIPSRRPMDNMKAGFDRPQEDEFALCMMGQPSPYLTIAFPNRKPQCQEFFDLENVSPAALRRWQKAFKTFLQQLTFKDPRRLVLKSPPHTCRIKVLRELFPGAIFIHIVRNPYVVFPSTINLWKTLYRTHGLQKPTFEGLEEHVLATFTHMYDRLETTRNLIAPECFFELRYEDLVREPVKQMHALYEHLGLGGWEAFRPRLEEYLAGIGNYETNRYQLTPEQKALIGRRWRKVIERYGYANEST